MGYFVGATKAKQTWLEDKVDSWVEGVIHLAGFACIFPQAAYAGLKMALQKEWKFLQSITPGIGPLFAPLEEFLREDFLPYLLGGPKEEVPDPRRNRNTWGVT